MKMPKKHARKQLEKFSTIFTQLGLVLVLFTVYLAIEYETEKKEELETVSSDDVWRLAKLEEKIPVVFVKDVPKKEAVQPKQQKPIDLTKVEKVDDNFVDKQVVDLPTNDDLPKIDLSKLDVDKVGEEEVIKPDEDPLVPMVSIQNAPVFKGCEGLNESDGRKCLEKKFKQYVQRYFDPEVAQDLGMRAGKYSIYTMFVIGKDGKITDVQIRAPHTGLKKEVNKVLSNIPQFTPGKQNEKAVKVSYTLPISFMVE